MTSPLDFTSYKMFLKSYLEQPNSFSITDLAKRSRIQRQYLSRVLNQNAHFSEDQAWMVSHVLALSDLETDYFIHLVRLERTALPWVQKKLKEKSHQIKEQNDAFNARLHKETQIVDDTNEHIKEYYLNLRLQLAHALLFLQKYEQDPLQLCDALDIEEDELIDLLKRLERMSFIKPGAKFGTWIAQAPLMHLYSPQHYISSLNHQNWRLWSVNKSHGFKRNLQWSSIIICEKESAEQFTAKLKTLISDYQKKIASDKTEEVYIFLSDFFKLNC